MPSPQPGPASTTGPASGIFMLPPSVLITGGMLSPPLSPASPDGDLPASGTKVLLSLRTDGLPPHPTRAQATATEHKKLFRPARNKTRDDGITSKFNGT